MKKFISLFVIAAVLAFAGTAFATGDGLVGIGDPKTPTGTYNNGSVAADGKTNVYFYDNITSADLLFGVKAGTSLTDSGTDVAAYKVGNGTFTATAVALTENISNDVKIAQATTLPVAKTGDTEVTVGVRTGSDTDFDGPTKTLTITPVEVKLAELGTVTVKAGESKNVDVELTDETLTPTFGEAFTAGAVSPTAGAPAVTPNALTGVEVDATSAKAGTYTVKISTGGSNSLKIEETDGADGITVANFPADAFEVGTLTIKVVDFEIDPTSATWVIGKSNDVVSFDVDTIAFANFNGISTDIDGEFIITSADKKGTDSFVSDDVVISCDATMVVSLDKAFLNGIAEGFGGSISPYVSIDETVNFGISTQDDKFGTFSVRFTRDAQPQPQSDDVVENAPADPNNSLLQATINTIGVEDAIDLVEAKGFTVAGNALSEQTVVNAISNAKAHVWGTNSAANVTSLPIVSADIQGNGTIATIRVVGIPGSYLVSDDTRGRVVNANDLNVMKIVASNDVTRLARAGDVKGKTAEQLNGTFNVYRKDSLVDSVNSKSDDYELRVYIVDNGKYDLNDKVDGNVVDPLALVKSTGGSGSSSSGCDLGFGLIAAAGLAALALRKRSK